MSRMPAKINKGPDMSGITGIADQVFAAINYPVFVPVLWVAAASGGGAFVSIMWGRFIRSIIARDRDGRLDRIGLGFVLGVGCIVMWLFVLMIVAHAVPVLNKVATALLASVSIASIVIGLAAQSTLSNLVAGLSLAFYRPFRIGDKLQVTAPTGLEMGTVEIVNLGYTVLSTFDNRRIVVPNAVIATATTVNHTAVDPRILAQVPFSIAYDADIDRARAVAIELAGKHPGVVEIVGCPVVALSAFSVDLSLRVWAADAGAAATVRFDLLERIKARFDVEGIEIPFPARSVILSFPQTELQPLTATGGRVLRRNPGSVMAPCGAVLCPLRRLGRYWSRRDRSLPGCGRAGRGSPDRSSRAAA